MTLKDALDNLMVDLNSYQVIHVITSKTTDDNDITYSIGIAFINDKYIFHIESDECIVVQDYQMDSAEKAKVKLTWLINKYSLMVKSIIYVTNMQINEILAKCYYDNILTYTFETKRLTRNEMLIRYTTITHPINYESFICDFNSVVTLVKKSCQKYGIELVLKQEHPLVMVRRLKLDSIN